MNIEEVKEFKEDVEQDISGYVNSKIIEFIETTGITPSDIVFSSERVAETWVGRGLLRYSTPIRFKRVNVRIEVQL